MNHRRHARLRAHQSHRNFVRRFAQAYIDSIRIEVHPAIPTEEEKTKRMLRMDLSVRLPTLEEFNALIHSV